MTLTAGARLGPYQIGEPIGAGGMGEVYRATDTNLKRAVAIKVLPSSLATDPDRLARFQREAEVLGSLNHPNIGGIHGLEDSGGITALVLELVEGPTLADRIARGAIPLDEALPIARQVADALEAAHEQGIIHRDLKPANIKVRDDGTVKVLDFGLAKLVADPARAGHHAGGPAKAGHYADSPTITSPALMTTAGVLLGTGAYMSPEQAKGREADRRSDIWAFGCVLVEMLTGTRAFPGDDLSETLAAVIKSEPDWDALPPGTPPSILRVLRRCLRKDPRQRLGDAAAARLEIEDALAAPADAAALVPQSQRAALLRVTAAVGLLALVAGLAIGVWLRSPSDPAAASGVARLTLPLSPGSELGNGASVVISPDGTHVAYVASQGGVAQLHIRSMSDSEARALAGTQRAANPFFSPDGQWVAFFADGKLKKASTAAGVVETLADATANAGGAWGPNDTIVFRPGRNTLVEMRADGGAPRSLQTPEQVAAGGSVTYPHFLPGGEAILVETNRPGGSTLEDKAIGVLTLETGDLKTLVQEGSSAQYLPTGHLVFLRDGTLMAVPFDLGRLELAGTPVEVLAGVRQQTYNGIGAFSCSRSGSCVYVAGGTGAQRTVALVDRTGASRPLPLPPKNYVYPRFSPKGDKLSFWLEQLRCYIEVYDIAGGGVTRLISDGDNHYPVWAPDGRISYESGRRTSPSDYRSQLVSQPANGGGSEELLATIPQGRERAASLSWSQSGELAFVLRGDIWLLPRSGKGEPRPFAPSKSMEFTPAFSHDGRWLAYVSDESGGLQVYVRPFPGPGERYPISVAGGSEPVWAHSGKELFFRNGDQVMVVDVVTQTGFSASRPRLLFRGNFARGGGGRINYDVSPDGANFVMLNSGEEDRAATQIDVVLNWHEELKRLVPMPQDQRSGRLSD